MLLNGLRKRPAHLAPFACVECVFHFASPQCFHRVQNASMLCLISWINGNATYTKGMFSRISCRGNQNEMSGKRTVRVAFPVREHTAEEGRSCLRSHHPFVTAVKASFTIIKLPTTERNTQTPNTDLSSVTHSRVIS